LDTTTNCPNFFTAISADYGAGHSMTQFGFEHTEQAQFQELTKLFASLEEKVNALPSCNVKEHYQLLFTYFRTILLPSIERLLETNPPEANTHIIGFLKIFDMLKNADPRFVVEVLAISFSIPADCLPLLPHEALLQYEGSAYTPRNFLDSLSHNRLLHQTELSPWKASFSMRGEEPLELELSYFLSGEEELLRTPVVMKPDLYRLEALLGIRIQSGTRPTGMLRVDIEPNALEITQATTVRLPQTTVHELSQPPDHFRLHYETDPDRAIMKPSPQTILMIQILGQLLSYGHLEQLITTDANIIADMGCAAGILASVTDHLIWGLGEKILQHEGRVVGLEIVNAAIEMAKSNYTLNKHTLIAPVEFYQSDLWDALPEHYKGKVAFAFGNFPSMMLPIFPQEFLEAHPGYLSVAMYAGGHEGGRDIILKALEQAKDILAPKGMFMAIIPDTNDLQTVLDQAHEIGFDGLVIAEQYVEYRKDVFEKAWIEAKQALAVAHKNGLLGDITLPDDLTYAQYVETQDGHLYDIQISDPEDQTNQTGETRCFERLFVVMFVRKENQILDDKPSKSQSRRANRRANRRAHHQKIND